MRDMLPLLSCIVSVGVGVGAFLRGAAAEDATSFAEPSGWSVGQADSTYQEWDVFTGRSGNAPDVGHYPLELSPTFSAAAPAFLTGTKNLYSYAGDYDWRADVKNYGNGAGHAGMGTHVIVQTATTLNGGVGVLLDSLAVVKPDGSAISGGDNASALRETTLFEGQIWVEAMGQFVTTQERLWEFYLPDYFDDFRVVGHSRVDSSFLAARIDSMIAPVPEPGTITLAGAGLLALVACRLARRNRRRSAENS